jgi:hypothetical protein
MLPAWTRSQAARAAVLLSLYMRDKSNATIHDAIAVRPTGTAAGLLHRTAALLLHTAPGLPRRTAGLLRRAAGWLVYAWRESVCAHQCLAEVQRPREQEGPLRWTRKLGGWRLAGAHLPDGPHPKTGNAPRGTAPTYPET